MIYDKDGSLDLDAISEIDWLEDSNVQEAIDTLSDSPEFIMLVPDIHINDAMVEALCSSHMVLIGQVNPFTLLDDYYHEDIEKLLTHNDESMAESFKEEIDSKLKRNSIRAILNDSYDRHFLTNLH
ncbi:hypothetical protein O3U67_10710 [Brevundimonas diminuta]|uniref:hypothetical protein n=1 Tax=Brevundimonas diminuta TaxID=293 RepID=UPI0022AF4A11|nr:hypothetical protein [Brevundimonas diminuta]MCZ4108552.1 hypothetical protein [Brevundimonas diminuta]